MRIPTTLRAVCLAACSVLYSPVFAAALPFHGWTLTHDDLDYNLGVIRRMGEFGVTHVQLSHRIVTRVDQLQNEPEVVARVRTLADAIHAQGGQAIVWMQELNTSDTYSYCFDPEGEQMQAKMQAYRDALAGAPEIDGVMISFGSAPTELQYIVPSCQVARFAQPKERYKAMIEAISRVVMDEFGKQVYVRTFYHKAHEIPILRDALKETARPLVVMSKSEPNDFEPYYPLNPLIADVGPHDQVFELDCAGEYWGRGAIPFVAVEYFVQRFRQALERQQDNVGRFIGSTCRVDRYEYSAMGSLNEANLFAQAQLVADPLVDAASILSRYVEKAFAVQADRQAHQQLVNILRRTYWVGRKMYYAKGEWAFKKGSDLPASNADALSNMVNKTITQWDPAYTLITAGLLVPTERNLTELLQEKYEALDIAERNLMALSALQGELADHDYARLEALLLKQRLASEVWLHMAGAVFAARNLALTSSRWVAWHLDQMEAIADALDQGAYSQIADLYPVSSDDIRAFVANERGALVPDDGVALSGPVIAGIDVTELAAEQVRIAWQTEPGVSYRIELTQQLPAYSQRYPYASEGVAPGPGAVFTITDLQPDSPYWFRLVAQTADGEVASGDYPVWTAKADEGVTKARGGGGVLEPDSLWIALLALAWRRRRRRAGMHERRV